MKINWIAVIEMVIAFCLAQLATEFLIAPAADWAYGKIKGAFEKA